MPFRRLRQLDLTLYILCQKASLRSLHIATKFVVIFFVFYRTRDNEFNNIVLIGYFLRAVTVRTSVVRANCILYLLYVHSSRVRPQLRDVFNDFYRA